jgi:hypothetical protein
VGSDVKALEIFAPWLDFLEYADVFPQVLQVLGGLLEE